VPDDGDDGDNDDDGGGDDGDGVMRVRFAVWRIVLVVVVSCAAVLHPLACCSRTDLPMAHRPTNAAASVWQRITRCKAQSILDSSTIQPRSCGTREVW
jgi:hypothetical protein